MFFVFIPMRVWMYSYRLMLISMKKIGKIARAGEIEIGGSTHFLLLARLTLLMYRSFEP